ncbi:MAG: tRNA (adenosine(37)-N6)-threonylcarbamoyltransferase complex dimerization subunit type 1 TsaB [Abditibacteriaceae bacterium]
MKCLLCETSGVPWGVGVAEIDGDKSTLLSHFEDDGARTLARQLIQSIDQGLVDAKCELSDIDACVVSLGPGSWTGLRIGLTAAKTLAQSLNLPMVGIATFDIFAEALQQPGEENLLLVQSPCRPGELYTKLWHCRGVDRDLLEEERIDSYAQINSRLEFWMNDLKVFGIVTNTPDQKVEESFTQAILLPLEFRKSTFEQRLQALGKLAAKKMDCGQWDDILKIQPIYLAPSAAEREYNAKHNRK